MHSLKRPLTSKRLSPLSFITTALLLLSAGCTHVQIQDHEWCADAGTQGAFCFHTLTSDTRDIPAAEWEDLRFGQICTADPSGEAGATFADTKAVIEKLCSLSGRCTYVEKKYLADFFARVETALARAASTKKDSDRSSP